MRKKTAGLCAVYLVLMVGLIPVQVDADEFTNEDLERWEGEFMSVVNYGRELWVSGDMGGNGVACAQCHPNAANTHPETYPKFQQQLGKVIGLRDMINWCLMNPLEGDVLELDSREMIAMEAYVHYERRGVKLQPGKH
jgi:cytochrome c